MSMGFDVRRPIGKSGGRRGMKDDSPKAREAAACTPASPAPIEGFPKFGHIPLQGVINCRDLGGMPTADGRRIRKRRLMRSADLHDATAEDMKQLVRMHDLEYVVDLRADYEVENAPDPIPLMTGIEYVHLPALSDDAIGFSGLKNIVNDVKMLSRFSKDPVETIEELYYKCVMGEYGKRAYKTFLNDLLKSGDGGSLWHCTQGKDRTGIAAILVEYSLGVSPDHIRRDYLATNLFIKPWVDKMNSLMRNKVLVGGLGIDLEAYTYANMCYFDKAVETIVDNYGSMDNYLTRALDFDPDKRAKLRELYLE